MKKKLIVLASLIILCASLFALATTSASADTEGYYTYTVSDGKAQITDVDTSISGDITIPSTLGGYPVTSIGSRAFEACSGLTSITFAEGSKLESIGNYAFSGCSGLTSIEIPASVTSIGRVAFSGCVGLKVVTVNSSDVAKKLTSSSSCGRLINCAQTIIFPTNIVEIGSYVTEAFTHLDDITQNGQAVKLYSMHSHAESASTWVEAGGGAVCSECGVVKTAPCSHNMTPATCDMPIICTLCGYTVGSALGHSFGEWQVIKTPTYIENGVETRTCSRDASHIETRETEKTGFVVSEWQAGENVFAKLIAHPTATGKYGLAFVGSGDVANYYGSNTPWYGYCSDILEAYVDVGVTSIGYRAFFNCTALTSIIFAEGSKLESIGDEAFYECSRLTSIEIPAGVTSIGDDAFYNCTGLTSIEIPESVTSIDGSAFYNCTGLTSIEIPTNVTSIGFYAFSGCSGLTSITFAEGSKLESIGSGAFAGCINIRTAAIPAIAISVVPKGNLESVIVNGGTSIGYEAFYNCKSLTSIEIPASVTSIGDEAFANCSGLTSIEIPESVTSIGDRAFFNCTGLTSITFAEGSKLESIGYEAFYNCKSLTSIEIPEGVTSIGSLAFSDCTGLTSIEIPESVTSIGFCAFAYCRSLTSITIPASVTSIGDEAFYSCDSLTSITFAEGSKLESIGEYVFYDCFNLPSITIPKGVTSIGNSAFYYCTDLTSITFAEGSKLESIGDYAFYCCDSLTSIEIPEGVTSIGSSAFYNCKSLTLITVENGNPVYHSEENCLIETATNTLIAGCQNSVIPSYVTSIGSYAFYNCSDLTSITFAEGSKLESIGYSAFEDCSSLTSITIPAGVTSIGDYAFAYCTGITSITFAEGSKLESIGKNAFGLCDSLTSIEIPESVTSIGSYAFAGCSGLTSITFAKGSNLESIGYYAFQFCKSLAAITIPEDVTSIGGDAFWYCSGLTSITVENGNSVYHSEGNCLIETATNTLILGCQNSVIPSYVTSIGEDAFMGCTGLTSIEIPAGVTSIDYSAFYECTGLTSIEIPESVTSIGSWTFADCSGLTSVTFAEGSKLESIGYAAFYFCRSLTSIEIPAGVTSIDYSAFYECTGLTSIEIPESVTSIGNYAFYECTGLTSIEIPEGVTSIGSWAFENCSGLKLVTVNSATVATALTSSSACGYLAYYAQTVVIPSTVTEIGSYVTSNFTCVDAITQNGRPVTLYSTHSHADDAEIWDGNVCTSCGVAKGCSHDMTPATCDTPATCTLCGHTEGDALGHAYGEWQVSKAPTYTEKGIVIRICANDPTHTETRETESLTPIIEWSAGDNVVARLFAHPTVTGKYVLAFVGSGAMASYDEIKTPWRGYNSKISEVYFGNGVTTIGAFALEDLRGLLSVDISASVTQVTGNPFVGCVSLTSITVSDENTVYHAEGNCLIETQANKVVSGCKTSVIPAYVTTIGASAFEGSAIKALTFADGSALTTIEEYAFAYCQNLEYAILPAKVTTIGAHAFSDCMAMYAVTVENGATLANVDSTAFAGCTALTLVVVESNDVAENITEKDSFGGLFANVQTVAFAENVTTVSDYVKNTFLVTDTLTSDGEEVTVYSKHAHTENSHVWADAAGGKICTECGVMIADTYVEGVGMVGDINGDGSVTVLDIAALVNIASGKQ